MVSEPSRCVSTREHHTPTRHCPAYVLPCLRFAVSILHSSRRSIADACSLFRPYVKLDLSGANLFPRDTCTLCANDISGLMNILRAMYGMRRVCLAVPSLLLSASTIHLLNLPAEPSATHLSQGLHDLQAMSMNHTFAARCVDIVRSLATKWNIALPEGAASVSAFRAQGPRTNGSPRSSTFWGASIPRDDSAQSSGSSASQPEGPFAPPGHSQQQQASFATFFSDPTTPLDPSQTQPAFWIPFPGQMMPLPQQPIVPSMAMDLSGLSDDPTQWHMYGGAPEGPASSVRHTSLPGQINDNSGFQNWGWQ
jgi:hypothetical protein